MCHRFMPKKWNFSIQSGCGFHHFLHRRIMLFLLSFQQALAQKLKSKLETARQAKATQPSKPKTTMRAPPKPAGSDEDDDGVLLTRTDRSGQSWPLPDRTVPIEEKTGHRKKKQKVAHLVIHLFVLFC